MTCAVSVRSAVLAALVLGAGRSAAAEKCQQDAPFDLDEEL
jgi:hypothetical protein